MQILSQATHMSYRYRRVSCPLTVAGWRIYVTHLCLGDLGA